MDDYVSTDPMAYPGLVDYRVRPEGMSLEEWYLQDGPITPPASDYDPYSGPPGTWAGQPVYLQPMTPSGGTDVAFMPPPAPGEVTTPQTIDQYVEDQYRRQGFVKGEYGGWYKPSTQEERPIPGPISYQQPAEQDYEQKNNVTNGNGGGGNGFDSGSGSSTAMILLLIGAVALGMGG